MSDLGPSRSERARSPTAMTNLKRPAPPRSARGRSLSPRRAPSGRRRRRCSRSAASGEHSKMIEPEAEIALPAAGGVIPEGVELVLVRMQARAAHRSSPGGRSAATTAAPRAASPRHCAVARAEKTSRSSGTTFQSPHRTAGRSPSRAARRRGRGGVPSSGSCSRTSRCRPDCRWGGRASRRRPRSLRASM